MSFASCWVPRPYDQRGDGGVDLRLLGQIDRFQQDDGGKRLPIQGGIAAGTEYRSFKKERGEPAALGDIRDAGIIGVIDQGAVDVLFSLITGAAANEKPFLLPYLLGAGQGLQGGGDIGVGARCCGYVQGARGQRPVWNRRR